MKRLFTFLFILCACSSWATNVLLSLSDARLQVAMYSNRVVVLQPMSTPTVSSPSVVLGGQITLTNDSMGNLWYSNLYSGLYHVIVLAPPDRADFAFLVTATNLGNINAADNLVAASTATFPAGSVAWAAAVSDGRYARNTNQPVSFYMVTNALGYTPQPATLNLTNWSSLVSNSLNTSTAYINATNGLGTNTTLTGITLANQLNATGLVTSAEGMVAGNFVGSNTLPLQVLGYAASLPIVEVVPVNGGATFFIDASGKLIGNGGGLTNLNQANQGLFQFGTLDLTNTSLYFGLNHETLLGSSTNGTPIAYTAGTDLQIVPGALSYTLNSTAAATVTNGLGVAISNYVLTVSQNATNDDLLFGVSATNNDNRLSLNSTNQSLLIGASATNDDLLFGVSSTNQSLLIGANATNQSLLIGASATNNDNRLAVNATNQSLLIGLGATNEALLIGANGTNESLLIGLNATNEALLIGANATNEAARVSLNNTNNTLLASNNLNTAKQQGSAVLTNITAATGTPSSSTFLRGDYSWAVPAGSGTGWSLTGNAGTTPGANFIGTTDNQQLAFKVNGSQVMLLRGSGSVLIGDSSDSINGPSDSVLSGHNNSIGTTTGGTYNTIAGGTLNYIIANGGVSFIGGGQQNGVGETAVFGSILGGYNNHITGNYGSVPGGAANSADGLYSFAAGQQAHAEGQGTFVWADSQNSIFSSTNADSFNIRAQGGTIIQGPLFALTNYAGYATITNPIVSGLNWTNTTKSRVMVTIDYTLTDSAISGFPGLCMTNLTTGEWFNATNNFVLATLSSGRATFLMSPNDILIATNKSSSSASAAVDASWAKTQ